ncbi:amino acid permease [Spiroplasma culicicola]|uniref:Amino acid permease family protein n=1 Tax=Spiroplasma culicicola AES-1 TaxID=1276246 RepID=W6A7T1_9MOLU|nr:amino acid permease [Spiroplasma culicicola]AHI53047.1 amino acid permease family protein [Spiroplasma culicicola AES-1]
MSSRTKTLTKATIVLMSFGIIFGFRNIINNQVQFGLLAAILFLVGGAIYAIPMVLITSEFGSIKKLKDQESGMGSFCVFTLGQKYGFLASWASYFGNLFFFATIAPFTIIALSFFFTGSNGFDKLAEVFYNDGNNGISQSNATRSSAIILALCAILLFWGGTFVSRKGPKWIGTFTNIGGTASLILGVLFIAIALFYTIPFGETIKFDSSLLDPINNDNGFKGDWWSFLSAFPWLIFAFNGIETMSVFVKDTKGGPKAFKIASVIGMSIVIGLMVVGTVVLSFTIDQETINSPQWGLSNSYYYVFPKILGLEIDSVAGKTIIHIVGLITALNGMGSMFFWTAGPAKVFFSEIPENVMGKYISKVDKNGIPVNALFLQAIVVSIILLIVGTTTVGEVGGGSSAFLTKITQATTSLATVQMFFYFGGYIKFRLKNDDEDRGTRFFKNKWPAIIISVITLVLLAIAFFFGTIPSPESWKADWVNSLIDFIFIFGGFIFFMGFGMFMWWYNMERKVKVKQGELK